MVVRNWVFYAAISLLCSCQENAVQKDSQLKVELLYKSLAASNILQLKANSAAFDEVYRFGRNNRYDSNSLRLAIHCDTIHQGAKRLLKTVRNLRHQLAKVAKNQTDSSVAGILVDKEYREQVLSLIEQVDSYADKVSKIDTAISPIQLVSRNIAEVNTAKDIADFYFADASITSSFAALAQIESKILIFEAEALKLQADRIGCNMNIVVDKVSAFARAESNTVTPGSIYKAELFLIENLKPKPVKMFMNGRQIPVSELGAGKIEFVVDSVGSVKGNEVKRNWLGEIQTTHDGRDTTYKVLVQYKVIGK